MSGRQCRKDNVVRATYRGGGGGGKRDNVENGDNIIVRVEEGSNSLEDFLCSFGGDFVEFVGGREDTEEDANDADDDDDDVQGFATLIQFRPLELKMERTRKDAHQHEPVGVRGGGGGIV